MRTEKSKYYLICIFGFLFAHPVLAQLNPETSFQWENPYYLNPASVNLDYRAYFSLSARKQWMSFPGSPATFFATGTLFLENSNMQTGVKILNDRIGYINTLDLSASYAYILRLSWNHFVNMGLSFSYQSQSIDRAKVELEKPNDPILQSERYEGFHNWNAGIGAEYVYDKSLTIGIASRNFLSFLQKEPRIFGGSNYLYARYRTRSVERNFDLEYGVCIKQYEKEIQAEGMFSFYLNRDRREEMLQLSFFGRSIGEMGILTGIKLMSELKFLCAYTYNLRNVSRNTSGSLEIMVTYPIHRNKICRSDWDRKWNYF